MTSDPDDTVEVHYDGDLDRWVIDGRPAGPAGVAAWDAAGVYWAADWIEPGQLVRCEIDADAVRPEAPGVERTLALVEALLGPQVRALVQVGPQAARVLAESERLTIGIGRGATARRAAGWLAVTLDEVDAGGNGADGGSLLAADALLLARRVGLGLDDLPGLVAPGHVAEIVDSLDPRFLDALAGEDRSAFDLLRAYGAVLASLGEPIDERLAPILDEPVIDPAEIASRFAAIVATPSFVHMNQVPQRVWCQGLPPGAVVDATARLVDGGRRVEIEVEVGDRPLDALYAQIVRTKEGALVAAGALRLTVDPERTILVGRAEWLVARGEHVRLVAAPDTEPPASLRVGAEAQHWAREAVHLARRGDQATAGGLWLRSAALWREAGVRDLAERAQARKGAAVEPSPYLRDRPAARRVLDDLLASGTDPGAVADTAQALGLVDLAAEARLRAAAALLDQGRVLGGRIAAGRARRDFARLADAGAADRPTALGEIGPETDDDVDGAGGAAGPGPCV